MTPAKRPDPDRPGGVPPPLPPPLAVRLSVLPPNPCPYLPDRLATLRAFGAGQLGAETYHAFMDAGFRRSGRMVYQPVCDGCRACVPIRVPVARFEPDKTQRRCGRRNADLAVAASPPEATDEKYNLYRRYVTQWHDHSGDGGGEAGGESDDAGRASFESFLYASPVSTLEFTYRGPGGRLLAVGIADVCAQSFSSVYFYFDPDHRGRSLGTFGATYEIGWARRQGIPYYYLGYWVGGCRKMAYKSNFHPYELLGSDGEWRPGGVASVGNLGNFAADPS